MTMVSQKDLSADEAIFAISGDALTRLHAIAADWDVSLTSALEKAINLCPDRYGDD